MRRLRLPERDVGELAQREAGIVGRGHREEQLAALLRLGEAGDVDLLVRRRERGEGAQVEEVPGEVERGRLGKAAAPGLEGRGQERSHRVERLRAGRGQRRLQRGPGALDVVARLHHPLEGDGEVGRPRAHLHQSLGERQRRAFGRGLLLQPRQRRAQGRLRRRLDGPHRRQGLRCLRREEEGDHEARKVVEEEGNVKAAKGFATRTRPCGSTARLRPPRCPPCAATCAPATRAPASRAAPAEPSAGHRSAAHRCRARAGS